VRCQGTNNNYNTIIVVNNYGKENTEYLTSDKIVQLLNIPYDMIQDLIKMLYDRIQDLIKMLYFNVEHPVNNK
jgi:hypothetical protein